MKTPEEVIQSCSQRATKLKVALLPDEQGGIVLVEGGRDDLEFLGHLLIALAQGGDAGFHIDPKGAGSAYFSPDSEFGLYLHRKDDDGE